MSDSVYVAITANRFDPNLTTVLFLRRSNGQWWLPGGRILPQHVTSTKAIEYWVEKLLPLDDLSAEETGRWCLSQEAGGHEVRLFEKKYGQAYTSTTLLLIWIVSELGVVHDLWNPERTL